MKFKTTIYVSVFLVTVFFLSCRQEKDESKPVKNAIEVTSDKEIEEVSESLETDANALENELKELDNL